ncbi:MAG: NAD(P)-dependent oxidoreductase, partial [Sphingomonas sp.]
ARSRPEGIMTMQCGFIGLGDQGAPIAARMMRRYPLIVWARRERGLKPFRGTASEVAESIAVLGARSDHVGICVLGDANVREVCDSLIPAMRPGSRIALHSTTHPALSAALSAEAAARGLLLVDAPVSGGRPAAEDGTLTVMVGGEDAAVAAMRPVFETFGRLIVHLGAIGAGQSAKLLNNAMLGAGLGLAHAAVLAGDALGLDRPALLALIHAGSGASFAMDVYGRQKDLPAFVGRLSLFDQTHQLGEVLGTAHPAFQGLRDAAIPLFQPGWGRPDLA